MRLEQHEFTRTKKGTIIEAERELGKWCDSHRIVIWECQRVFFGVPTKWNIPGSKIVGDLMDQPYEKVALELKGHLEAFLQKMVGY